MLKELAQRFKGKLSRCEVYDANVCITRSLPSKPWELEPVSGEPFTERLQFTHRGRNVTVLASHAYVNGSVAGTFASGLITINARHRLAFSSEFADNLSLGVAQYPVFTEDGRVSAEQRSVLGRPELLSLVVQANLQEGESLYFTGGEIGFYLKRTDVGGLIDQLVELAEKVQIVDGGPKLDLLPVQFHPLIPMIKKWTVTDDSKRNDLLDATPKHLLRTLVDEVSPYFGAINSFLDSIGEEAPREEAVSLARLAECAVEAKQLLDRAHTN